MTPFPAEVPSEQREPTADERALLVGLNAFQAAIHQYAKDKGFWDFTVDLPGAGGVMIVTKQLPIDNLTVKNTKLILMVSELIECMEGLRNHLGEGNEAEELADCVIRILDYCGAYELPLAQAIIQKQAKNLKRPHKHGGKAF